MESVSCTKTSTTTLLVTAVTYRQIILGFYFFCFFLIFASLFRPIPYAEFGDTAMLVWNGYTATHCFNATVETSILPSLLKRFELEPYTKLIFRFALLFTATVRVFHTYVRCRLFEYNSLGNNPHSDGIILIIIYKMIPFLSCIQLFFGAETTLLNAFIDAKALPELAEQCMFGLICTSVLYMTAVITMDFRETNCSFKLHFKTPRYVIRIICLISFVISVFPAYYEYLYYVQERQCNQQATTPMAALVEYVTLIAILGFHFSELFDIDPIHFVVSEVA